MAGAVPALRWIVTLLRDAGVPFQAVGGLAAAAYGGRRPLVDLDFYVPDDAVPTVRTLAGPRTAAEHARQRGPHWDVMVVQFDYDGQRIEVGGADTAKLFDAARGVWMAADIGFDRSVDCAVLGVTVPVMPKSELVAYKTVLGREVDLVDLHELTGSGGAVDTRLAVYGSLAPGEANHDQLAGLAGTWESGTVRGRLHAEGWGHTYGYPGLRWNPDEPPVRVALLTAEGLAGHWDRLDRFEGAGYRRALVPVTVRPGRTVLAYIYLVRD